MSDLSPPSDHQAEYGVIGAVLLDERRLQIPAVAQLRVADFFDDAHARIWEVIRAEREHGKPLDLQVIARRLAQQPGEPLGLPFLTKLIDSAGTGYAAEYFAEVVADKARLRRQFYFAHKLQEQIAAGLPSEDVAGFIERHNEEERQQAEVGEYVLRSFADMRQKKVNRTLNPVIIDGIVREGETINVVSDSKVGKTWLVHGLALSICTGTEWLGFPLQQGRVLLLDNELHEPTLVYRIEQIARTLNLDDSYADQLDVECYRGRLVDIHAVVAMLKRIPRGKYKVVILDSLYRFAPEGFDENNNAHTTTMYNLLDAAAAHLGCAIVCVRHSSKGSQSNKSVIDTGAGAGAQARAVDCHLVLRAHEEPSAFVLDAALRSFPRLEPRVVRFDWPVFFVDPDLDPELLAPDKGRKPKAKELPGTPAEPAWTAARLAAEILTSNPQPQATIVEAAKAAGLSERRAKSLLDLAATSSPPLAFQWLTGDRRQKHYANVPQTTLSIMSEVAE